jgi:hypothetical protein
MVGVLALAFLGLTAYLTLKVVRNFLFNLERAKKSGLPYVIGRKLPSWECVLCSVPAHCALRLGKLGELRTVLTQRSLPADGIRLDGPRRNHRDTTQQDTLCQRVVMAPVRHPNATPPLHKLTRTGSSTSKAHGGYCENWRRNWGIHFCSSTR